MSIWKNIVILAASFILPAPAVFAAEDTPPLFDEIADTVAEQYCDVAFIQNEFPAIRQQHAPEGAAATNRPQFAAAVNAMLAKLGSSHTHYYTPDDAAYYQLISIFREHPAIRSAFDNHPPLNYPSIGVETETRAGKIFAAAVFAGGPAAQAGVLRGDELLSIDGDPFTPVDSLRSRVDQTARLTVRRHADAPPLTLDILPRRVDPKEEALSAERASETILSVDHLQIGYIHVLSYAGEEFHEELQRALLDGPLAEADALILDIRNGWGGANPDYLNLFNPQIPILSIIRRDGEIIACDSQWRKPVVLLVNGRVRSGKEILTYGFKKHGIGTVIGERTAGAVRAGAPFVFSDGSLLYLAVNDVRVDGETLEGQGVQPDIAVPMPLEYGEGRDPQLDAALAHLQTQLNLRKKPM